MNAQYEGIANGLFKITSSRYGKELPEAHLLCMMIAQIGQFAKSNVRTKREDALLYFKSDDFLKHCSVLRLDSNTVRRIFTYSPK